VRDGKQQEQLQPLGTLHDVGKGADRLGVSEIAALRGGAHRQMLLDEPGDRLRFCAVEAEAWAELPRDPCARDRVILVAPLRDVVEKSRDVQRPPVLDRADDRRRHRQLARSGTVLDLTQLPDGSDQMLVDREVVIQVELHQRHDLAELRDEPAKHTGLVHPPQSRLRILGRAKHVEKDAVGLRVGAHPVVDQIDRGAQQSQRLRVDERAVPFRFGEEADQVHRVTREHLAVCDVEAAVVDPEIGEGAQTAARTPGHRI
jgi:hypothetical protein